MHKVVKAAIETIIGLVVFGSIGALLAFGALDMDLQQVIQYFAQ